MIPAVLFLGIGSRCAPRVRGDDPVYKIIYDEFIMCSPRPRG